MALRKVKKSDYIPDRGDIVWVSLDPTKGHEQAGRRPALVVTSLFFNGTHNTAWIIPATSKHKGYSDEVELVGEKVSGSLLIAHMRSIDFAARPLEFIEKVSPHTLADVTELVEFFLRN
jgi:mRNA interferase MazF